MTDESDRLRAENAALRQAPEGDNILLKPLQTPGMWRLEYLDEDAEPPPPGCRFQNTPRARRRITPST